jgi:hypothetical protein
MKRSGSIEALLKRANSDFVSLKTSYEASLHEKHVREDLKVLIKIIFESLRSCLDYLAQDIFEAHCSASRKPDRLYFPIRSTTGEFSQALAKDYPGLQAASPRVSAVLEAIQPFNDPWLGLFNKLNNHNKHQDLVEQTRLEVKQVKVSTGGGSVSWGPGVKFGSGVSVMGVPIDPKTQLPVPNSVVKTEVITWVDFKFKEIDKSVLAFVESSIQSITKIFNDLKPLV